MLSDTNQFHIPNICRNGAVLVIVLITQVCAFVVAALQVEQSFLQQLGVVSLYLQWICLCCLLILCRLRGWLNVKSVIVAWLVATSVCLAVFLVTEFAIYNFISIEPVWDVARIARYSLVVIIVSSVVFRWFSLSSQLEIRGRAEAESKVAALQARIKPHFLFNSLNTISELTVANPSQAEMATNSLAKLFRAVLDEKGNYHSLAQELELCEHYLQLERWRLGDKLVIEQSYEIQQPDHWMVPKLILQPLLENAVVHGRHADGSVNIALDIRETGKQLSFKIENTIGTDNLVEKGSGTAVTNIKNRLELLFDDQTIFRVKDNREYYRVIMRLPKNNQRQMESLPL